MFLLHTWFGFFFEEKEYKKAAQKKHLVLCHLFPGSCFIMKLVRNSSLVVFGLAVHSVAGLILLWGNFPDSKDPDVHVLDGWMPATKNTPSTHHPRRRNVTTLMVGLKNGHIRKNLTQSGEPQRYSWGTPKKKKKKRSWCMGCMSCCHCLQATNHPSFLSAVYQNFFICV